MLTQQTLESLRQMRLQGMADAYQAQLQQPATGALAFDERFGLLVDREWTARQDRRLARLLKAAHLNCPHARRTSTLPLRVASTAPSCASWPARAGCANTTTCSSPGRPASAKPIHHTTPLDLTFLPTDVVTVVDPAHPLAGQTFPLIGVTNKQYIGSACVVSDPTGHRTSRAAGGDLPCGRDTTLLPL